MTEIRSTAAANTMTDRIRARMQGEMNESMDAAAVRHPPAVAWRRHGQGGRSHRTRRWRQAGTALLMSCLAALPLAQASQPGRQPFTQRLELPPVRVEPIGGLRAHLQNGKLRLRLADFLQLALQNNTGIHLMRLAMATANDAVLSARAPFDPQLQIAFNALRSIAPQYAQTSGAVTLNSLAQQSQAGFSELLPGGQHVSVDFTTNRSSSNNRYAFFNPTILSGLNFTVMQPLWRDRNNISNLAPLQMARTQLMITSDVTEAQIADSLVQAADQYWSAVQARDAIKVQQQALDLAQKSYDRDRHALQLGALPKLDIYQSEAQVARTRLALVQAQYAYREQLDALRQLIGADLNPQTRGIDIVLEDDPAPLLENVPNAPVNQAIDEALRERPETHSMQRQLSIDNLNARVARNSLRPRLDLTGQYSSAGEGGGLGPAYDGASSFTPGGFSNALHQLFAFNSPSYGFGLQLTFPVRNSAGEARLADALVSHARDDYQMRQARQQIIQQVLYADNQLHMAQAQIEAARTARDLAAKNVQAEQQKYELGSTTIFEVLQAQVQLSQDETSLLAANIGFQKALVAYRRATWTLFQNLGLRIDPAGRGPALKRRSAS